MIAAVTAVALEGIRAAAPPGVDVRPLAEGPGAATFVVPAGDDDLAAIAASQTVQVVQTLSAGTDWMEPHLPPQATLCAARGARDNANMTTRPDGSPSITNMYLWQPVAGAFYAPCVDGDYDAGVIGHEYGHMIENRMIGKGAGRSGHHAGAMGESVGDLMSIEQLNENGHFPTDGANRWATGTYATGEKLRGIRNYAGNFPSQGAFPTPGMYAQVDPLNFSDIGYDVTGPQVHADGEIWTATNFDIRRALAAKYDAQYPEGDQALQERCARGEVPVDRCPGNRRWIQLLFDSYLLDPTAPSMVDARNSLLAADTIRFGGANQAELWLAFARRGLGAGASATNGTGRSAGVESDTNPLPDFAQPGTANAALTFAATARDAAQTPVAARIYVGHYEARVSPVADTDPATSAPAGSATDNLDATASFAPGTYEFVATAPGYGAVRFRRTVRAGVAQSLTLRMAPNVASKTQGAVASGDAAALVNGANTVLTAQQVRDQLIDDTENTWWQAAATQNGATLGRRRAPGHRRPRRHAAAADQPRAGQRLPRAAVRPGGARRPAAEPVHRAAPVRALVLQRAVQRLQHRRRLQPDLRERRERIPGRRAAAGRADPAATRVHVLARAGHAPAAGGPQQPVHRRPGLPGRAGRRSVQRDRLQRGRACLHAGGARRRAAGVRPAVAGAGRIGGCTPGRTLPPELGFQEGASDDRPA